MISILHDMDFVAETFDRAIVFAKGDALLDPLRCEERVQGKGYS